MSNMSSKSLPLGHLQAAGEGIHVTDVRVEQILHVERAAPQLVAELQPQPRDDVELSHVPALRRWFIDAGGRSPSR